MHIVSIVKMLGIVTSGGYERVRRVLCDIWANIQAKTNFEPHQEGHGGHKKLILVESVEAEMIADIKEEGLSLLVPMHQVNEYRRTKGLGHVGWSAVRSAYIRMCPVVTKIMPCAQGSTDPESPWLGQKHSFCGLHSWLLDLGP